MGLPHDLHHAILLRDGIHDGQAKCVPSEQNQTSQHGKPRLASSVTLCDIGKEGYYMTSRWRAVMGVTSQMGSCGRQDEYCLPKKHYARLFIMHIIFGILVTKWGNFLEETYKYSAATFLYNAGIETQIDDQHAIAHNKIMIIDDATIITGSFNFTKAAEEKNAENLLVIKDAPDLVQQYTENVNVHAMHSHPYVPGQVSAKNTRKR
jgi:phosphatidylserine/phosphatidylglycerophosphate/cardiolipin synthase-like enzyme